MNMLLEERDVHCPYCGESFSISIDCSAGNQQYIEDCYVCCSPIIFNIEVDMESNLIYIKTQRENE